MIKTWLKYKIADTAIENLLDNLIMNLGVSSINFDSISVGDTFSKLTLDAYFEGSNIKGFAYNIEVTEICHDIKFISFNAKILDVIILHEKGMNGMYQNDYPCNGIPFNDIKDLNV